MNRYIIMISHLNKVVIIFILMHRIIDDIFLDKTYDGILQVKYCLQV